MNNTCLEYQNLNPSELLLSLIEIRDIVINYVIRGISGIGIFFNIFSLTVVLHKSLKHNFYDFLRCRCICNLIVCILTIFYGRLVLENCPVNYQWLYFAWFINVQIRLVLLASSISDILLIINRYVTIYDMKKSVFYKISRKVF